MHRFFPKALTRSATGWGHRASLNMEVLEDRTCLSAPGVSLSVSQLAGHLVRVTGQVTDERPNTARVTLAGVVAGTVAPSANGSFTFDAQASALGVISAVAADDEGLASAPATATLTNSVPSIKSLKMTPGLNGQATLSGRVVDEAPGGLKVAFTGIAPVFATTDALGNFSVSMPSGQAAATRAQVADGWGAASMMVPPSPDNNLPPEITSFTASRVVGTMWTFSGRVADECPRSCNVILGGLKALDGDVVMVDENGWFCMTTTLPAGESGMAEAMAVDSYGLESEAVEAYVTA